MNIKKYYRLNTSEIRYITSTKRKKFISGKILNMNIIEQYAWKNYNKFAISISNKFHKKAVYRNIIRRIYFDIIYKKWYLETPIKNKFWKIYCSLKKWVEYDVKWEDYEKQVRKDLEKDLFKLFGK